MSSDLATLFTGRHMEIHVYPFSFKEYCAYFDIGSDYDAHFERYIKLGGLSGSYTYKTTLTKRSISGMFMTQSLSGIL